MFTIECVEAVETFEAGTLYFGIPKGGQCVETANYWQVSLGRQKPMRSFLRPDFHKYFKIVKLEDMNDKRPAKPRRPL